MKLNKEDFLRCKEILKSMQPECRFIPKEFGKNHRLDSRSDEEKRDDDKKKMHRSDPDICTLLD